MSKQIEFLSWLTGSTVRYVASSAVRRVQAQRLADTFGEFVLRLRRAGLLFVAAVGGLLALSVGSHPLGLLIWLIALPLTVFGSLLSMLWPTRRFSKRKSRDLASADAFGSTRAWLVRARGEIPLASRAAFDLVVDRVSSIESLADPGYDFLVVSEARRLISQHLPRLVQSFLALPPGDRTVARTEALTEGLAAIAEELVELRERLLASRSDRFEIERQFIQNRYPRRNGLAGV